MDDDTQPTGRLLINAFRQFETTVLARLNQRGFGDVTPSHLNVIRHLDPQGLSMTDLARDAALSKAAIGKIVNELATKGYVKIDADPHDARFKRILYTDKGQRLVASAVDVIRHMENSYVELLGERRYKSLRSALNALITSGRAQP